MCMLVYMLQVIIHKTTGSKLMTYYNPKLLNQNLQDTPFSINDLKVLLTLRDLNFLVE